MTTIAIRGKKVEQASCLLREKGIPALKSPKSPPTPSRLEALLYKRASEDPSIVQFIKARGKVIIADGYHRLCAVYSYDEDAVIPCKIA
jgi:hypothetical protein